MNNPLFDFFTEHGEKFNDWKEREEAVQKWAWAVPNKEALNAIKRHSPIAEIGCGSGYWAMLLKEMGVDVTAYDQEEDKKQKEWTFRKEWFPIITGGPEKAALHPERALFLCWPPYEEPFAAECLKAYKGDTLIYVGEGWGGCNANEEFWKLLELGWEEEETIFIPTWYGLHDSMTILHRR